jgi:hypothetical protein
MHRFKLSAVQVEDLAYRLGQSEGDVSRALDDLVTLELVQVQCVCEHTFYRLNRDPSVLAKVDALFDWQAKWQFQVQRLDGMLRLN